MLSGERISEGGVRSGSKHPCLEALNDLLDAGIPRYARDDNDASNLDIAGYGSGRKAHCREQVVKKRRTLRPEWTDRSGQ